MNFKRTIFAIVVVMGLLIVIPFMIPTDTYIRQIEQGVSEKLGGPVKVRGLHLALLPSPRANIRDVVIGRDAEIQIERISAVLDMSTLFDHVKVISRLEFRRPVVKQAALEILGALAGEENSPEAAASVAVRRIVLKKAQLEWEGLTLPLLDADVAMSEDGRLQQAVIASEDNKLSIKASPKGAGYDGQLVIFAGNGCLLQAKITSCPSRPVPKEPAMLPGCRRSNGRLRPGRRCCSIPWWLISTMQGWRWR